MPMTASKAWAWSGNSLTSEKSVPSELRGRDQTRARPTAFESPFELFNLTLTRDRDRDSVHQELNCKRETL
jgi:hypothetical protein